MITPIETEKLLFIDTEFSSLDPYTGEVLSVGMVTLDGRELYLELEYDGETSDWVKKHILKGLKAQKVSRIRAIELILEFVGGEQYYAVAFVDNYDTIYLTKLFGVGNLPFRWLTIDFASILFALGVQPARFLMDQSGARAFYRKLGIDPKNYRQHHALDDARLLRDVWIKLIQAKNSISNDDLN